MISAMKTDTTSNMQKKDLKILFTEPLSSMNAVWGKLGDDSGNNNFMYGVGSILSYMRESGFSNLRFMDPNLEKIGKDEFVSVLAKERFDVVAMSCFTASAGYVYKTLKVVKETLPDCITVIGGIHPTLSPEECLKESAHVDVIVIGEGEITFKELSENIIGRNDLDNVKGICFRKNSTIIKTLPREHIKDINMLPMPAYDLFPMDRYVAQVTHVKLYPSYIMLNSRGCCYQCAFCHANAIHGRRIRHRSPDNVIKEMLYLKDNFGAKGISFYDSTFTIKRNWVVELCNKMIEKNVGLAWECNTRTDKVDEELLTLMKKAGCWGVNFGIESGNQKSLDLIRKANTVEQNTKSVKTALKIGLFVVGTYIICLPGENEEDVINTINYARELGTHQALFYLPIPYPKTLLYQLCEEEGGLRKDVKWEDYNAFDFDNPVYVNKRIGKEKMIKLYNHAFRVYYLTPKVILRNLMQIDSKDAIKKYWMGIKTYLKFI